MHLKTLESILTTELELLSSADAAHDQAHVLRVVKVAKQLAKQEQAQLNIILAAAYLHDCVAVAKNDPRRKQASTLAANKAIEFLSDKQLLLEHHDDIHHAIMAHSFSADIKPLTLEAKIVQDADRLDALGAIGLTRCIQVGTALGRPLYALEDPFCKKRQPDDTTYTLDHFYIKLLDLADTMQTDTAKIEAVKRIEFMKSYLLQLESEI
ncbi:putative two-component regulator with metal-dependent phosphohydrolase, HD region [Photobacterium sp. SKA34]|uniref:HD domain-containing protein n=1 Tax=Photobacterium sp. SKA34 TaxID=121723 RepID=UPI00006AEB7D|nr:HD domain-containing protein [Photobacterium sp. SKA34]EAR57382.1 putative two-component regulator with metal-dependent phosphohydrolase, HD region [Photobacterium sp. SKA34]